MQDGRGLHEKKLAFLKKWEHKEQHFSSMNLYSHKHQIYGKGDIIVIKNETNEIFPMECKRGKIRESKFIKMQLALQALCLEEMKNTTIKKLATYFFGSNQRVYYKFTKQLRNQSIELIKTVNQKLKKGIRAFPKINEQDKCNGCSFYPYCLPNVS